MWSKVRKFGLSHCDLPTMIWNVSVFLRVLGLNIDNRHTKRIPVYRYVFLIVTMSCYIYVYTISMVWFVFWKCNKSGDVIAAMIVFSLGTASSIAVMKLLFMFLKNETMKKIVDAYLESDALVVPGSRFAENILKTLKVIKKRAMLYWITIIGNGCAYALKPIITPGRHLMEDRFVYLGLEPMYESPNYQIASSVATIGVLFIVYVAANVTAFFMVIAGYIEAQMRALGEELNYFWEDAKIHYNLQLIDHVIETQAQRMLNEYVKKQLKFIARSHINNILLLQKVESVFRGMIAAEFLILIISLIAVLLGRLENTYLQLPFCMMMVAIDCLIGQKLFDASIAFQTAVYNCKWENFDKSNMKTVLLMLRMSQREMTLSAGGIATLNYETLMDVLRSVYSAYTTLRSAL